MYTVYLASDPEKFRFKVWAFEKVHGNLDVTTRAWACIKFKDRAEHDRFKTDPITSVHYEGSAGPPKNDVYYRIEGFSIEDDKILEEMERENSCYRWLLSSDNIEDGTYWIYELEPQSNEDSLCLLSDAE
jgi:hypothetical protein